MPRPLPSQKQRTEHRRRLEAFTPAKIAVMFSDIGINASPSFIMGMSGREIEPTTEPLLRGDIHIALWEMES